MSSKFRDLANDQHSKCPRKKSKSSCVGPTGPPGRRGERGEVGETGPTGGRGEIGDVGETGPTGGQGERGEVGDVGETGPTGGQGERGEVGETGPTGERGERGEVGPVGFETNQTLYVDAVFGNDSPAGFSIERQNPANPFRSLAAANAAAAFGQINQIVVRPGSYSGSNLDSIVTWVFETGTVIELNDGPLFTGAVLGVRGGLTINVHDPNASIVSGLSESTTIRKFEFESVFTNVQRSFGTALFNNFVPFSGLPINFIYTIQSMKISTGLLFTGNQMQIEVVELNVNSVQILDANSPNTTFQCEKLVATAFPFTTPTLFDLASVSLSRPVILQIKEALLEGVTLFTNAGGTLFYEGTVINATGDTLLINALSGTTNFTCASVNTTQVIHVGQGSLLLPGPFFKIQNTDIFATASGAIIVADSGFEIQITLANTTVRTFPGTESIFVEDDPTNSIRILGSVATSGGISPIANLITGFIQTF